MKGTLIFVNMAILSTLWLNKLSIIFIYIIIRIKKKNNRNPPCGFEEIIKRHFKLKK